MITVLDLIAAYLVMGLPIPLFGREVLKKNPNLEVHNSKLAMFFYCILLWVFWYPFMIGFLHRGAKK